MYGIIFYSLSFQTIFTYFVIIFNHVRIIQIIVNVINFYVKAA